jgi:hypothetical protein
MIPPVGLLPQERDERGRIIGTEDTGKGPVVDRAPILILGSTL